MLDFDAIVIGGGIVGLATASAMSKKYNNVLLLEKHSSILMETSSRNSEVVHAGIYYSDMPNKNDLCIRGRILLEEFCVSRNVNLSKIGKYIFSPSSPEKLGALYSSAIASGAHGLRNCSTAEIKRLNKWCFAKHAFFSANTGIIDSHALAFSLLREIEDNGGICSFSSLVTDVEVNGGYLVSVIDGNGDKIQARSQILVNCAGLSSLDVLDLLYADHEMENYYVKGHYFSARIPGGVPNLLYPVPEQLGLGVHLTVDLDGAVKFGPDTKTVSKIDYNQEIESSCFYKKVAANFRILESHSLSFNYAGIRPKIKKNDEVVRDFVFLTEKDHKLNGLVSLHGIDSPGLTSCLTIADKVMSSL